MMTEMTAKSTKKENKLTGFRIRILDDGSYVMNTENKNYEMCKEYSYQNMDELHKGMKEIMKKMGHGKHEDMLEKKY